eukprot:GHVP01062888.1.p1 GENE.GHVP01062888.1~~GHVP01062888.1.p1  ORF type:complete len:194 (+),score=26.71 GHVP01062888.1:632-1213(+)
MSFMDTLIGISGKGFSIIAANRNMTRSALIMTNSHERIADIGIDKFIGASGDSDMLVRELKSEIYLEEQMADLTMKTDAVASFLRNKIANSLRTRNPYQSNILIAGKDRDDYSLYWIDHLATTHKVPYAVHGHAAHFCTSIFDRNYKEDINVSEGIELIKKCIEEIKTRLLISQGEFSVRIVSSNGSERIMLE